MNKDDIFEEIFGSPEVEPSRVDLLNVEPATTDENVNARLAQNALLAIDRQREILSKPITATTDAREKRLQAEVAHQVLKTNIQIDENRFRARRDDLWPKIMAEVAFQKSLLGPLLNVSAQDDDEAKPASVVPE